jgi:hypothetical protein
MPQKYQPCHFLLKKSKSGESLSRHRTLNVKNSGTLRCDSEDPVNKAEINGLVRNRPISSVSQTRKTGTAARRTTEK